MRMAFDATPAGDVIVLDDPPGIGGDRRQSHRIPALAAPDAPPVTAGVERTLGQRRRRVAHRTRRKLRAVLFIGEHRCRDVRL